MMTMTMSFVGTLAKGTVFVGRTDGQWFLAFSVHNLMAPRVRLTFGQGAAESVRFTYYMAISRPRAGALAPGSSLPNVE